VSLEYPLCARPSFGPRPVIPDEYVCEYDELSHDCGECDLWRFSVVQQGVVFAFHVGVVSGSDEGRHIDGLADACAAAANMALASEGSAVAGDGRHPQQACRLFVVEVSQFGHIGEQGHGGDLADGGDAEQDFQTVRQSGIRPDDFEAFRVDLLDLAFDLFRRSAELALEQRGGDGLSSVGDPRALLHQAPARRDQFLEVFKRRFGHHGRLRFEKGAELRQDARIDWVGLGVNAKRLGEALGAARIEPGDGKPVRAEVSLDALVVAPRRFVDDVPRTAVFQPTPERPPPGLIVAETAM